ncbi:hypothetical protein K435DRAFT_877354 [Dendrothele bispora CBS 962.96]|uniref:Uncharacterized protein n=1 Tax=Dendrothele bispora (strain CBS 962.96) TaxID=1314807 RepID=A0A4S8KQ44_DENBC|nr:hypothetical protein K435DRAFT_877354 [Dendrothele bispora CBS 962.96]
MDFSDPYNSNFSPLAGGTQFANPPSAANGFHTSDARSTSSNLESNPPLPNGCPNCSSYHCKSDDEKFLRAMEEGRDDYRRRLVWIWYCICKAAPWADRSDHEQVWRTLVESDDIWSIWGDGDDSNLPSAPIPDEWYFEPENFDFITPIISQKIDLHSKNYCTLKLTPSRFPVSQNTSAHMRLAIVLWKTLLATRRVKYPRNPSSVNCEIPSLIPKWWDMLPGLVKDNLVIDDHSRDRFRMEKKRRRHTCIEDLPEEKMWSTWITVQASIGTSVLILDIPLNHKNCPQCFLSQKQPFGRSEFVKPHVLALWFITKNIFYPDSIWESPSIFSHYTSRYKDLDVGKSLFNQTTLHKVDEWLTDIWSISDDGYDNSDLSKHVGRTLDHIPSWLETFLNSNEMDLDPHWTETQAAISKISQSESSVGSESDSVEPACWVSAVALFTLTKIYGLGPLTAQSFVATIEYSAIADLLEEALLSNTPPSNKFHGALKRSGHTCWPEEPYGPNSLTNLYFSAYSLLLGTSNVPVVGCEERYHRTECTACHAKRAFHDLSLVLDDELLGPLQSLSDKNKNRRAKRLIIQLNYPRYKKDSYFYAPPLNHSDLMTLTKKLSSLSILFQYALDNVQDMGLLNKGEISLGYGSDNEYSEDEDEDEDEDVEEEEEEEEEATQAPDIEDPEEEEDTQASGPSIAEPESSAQLAGPASNHENDALNFEHLENSAQPFHSVSGDNSSHAYHNYRTNFSATQVPQNQDVVTEGQTALLHPDYPPLPYTLLHTTPNPVQPQMPPQSGTDYTQSHSRIIESTDLFTMADFIPQENGHIFPFRGSENSAQHIGQIDDIFNGSDIPNPPLAPAPVVQPLENNPFIPETGTGHNTKPPRPPRVDDMRVEIKKQLITMLESNNIQITGGKLPWRNLFKTLQEHKCKFENWPAGTPEPSTQNGIEKAPQDEIKAIYKALIDKERPLRIRRIDGCLGGADRIFISQDLSGSGSGNKRSRDEQGSDIGVRENNRRRLGM